MRFTKMHGIGNDYVYVDCFARADAGRSGRVGAKIADRHFGVGGDGLILICPSQMADARMRMFNADGSEAEMCGNGVRCVAKYVYDHGIAKKPTLKIETGRGVLALDLEIGDGKVQRVRVDMGEPILEPAEIPVAIPDCRRPNGWSTSVAGQRPDMRIGRRRLEVRLRTRSAHDLRFDGQSARDFYCEQRGVSAAGADVGPIFETFADLSQAHQRPFRASPLAARSDDANLGARQRNHAGLRHRRSAVCVAGVLAGEPGEILAHLPGGDLELEWNETDNHVYMTGPATEVFSGEWPTDVGSRN